LSYIVYVFLSAFYLFFFFFFFFQAEDGIRDLYVTGVQTCALPIWVALLLNTVRWQRSRPLAPQSLFLWHVATQNARDFPPETPRSEERRVGKECRSRWSPDH